MIESDAGEDNKLPDGDELCGMPVEEVAGVITKALEMVLEPDETAGVLPNDTIEGTDGGL